MFLFGVYRESFAGLGGSGNRSGTVPIDPMGGAHSLCHSDLESGKNRRRGGKRAGVPQFCFGVPQCARRLPDPRFDFAPGFHGIFRRPRGPLSSGSGGLAFQGRGSKSSWSGPSPRSHLELIDRSIDRFRPSLKTRRCSTIRCTQTFERGIFL